MKINVFCKSYAFLVWVGLFFGLTGCGSDDRPELSVFDVSPKEIAFPENETSVVLKITSNLSWSITCDKDWCEVSPVKGEGNREVTLTLKENVAENDCEAMLTILTNENEYKLEVIRSVNNTPPAKAELKGPGDKDTGVCVLPTFDWEYATDKDGDKLSYAVHYSLDRNTWKISPSTEQNHCMTSVPLKTNTTYYWKVVTFDSKGGSSESAVWSFTTSSVEAYQDGEKFQYQMHTKGRRGVRIVILGDGFLPENFVKGAEFDRTVERAVNGLFSAEPFKTYRDYFDIYQIAAYSKEEGASIVKSGSESVIRDTRFNVRFVESPSMQIGDGRTGDSKVYDFVKVALNISEAALKETIIILISNENKYGGACYMNLDKKTIAICSNSTLERDPSGVWRDMEHVIAHEAGGHAIGLLADEYANEGNEEKIVPANIVNTIKEFVKADCYGNIDLTNEKEYVKWKHFIGRPGYGEVGFYEGGHEYGKGVWRAEKITCMDNNAWYYSAPAREAIVRRIMQLSGDEFDMELFYTNDAVKAYPYK